MALLPGWALIAIVVVLIIGFVFGFYKCQKDPLCMGSMAGGTVIGGGSMIMKHVRKNFKKHKNKK